MALQYKGINIPKEIIIVERQISEKYNEKIPQGFVVPQGKDNILETAMRWAHWSESQGYWENHKWVQTVPDKDKPGIQHLYKNGTFKIKLYDSANCSSQGGKLSFWNCTIIAEDGKEFIIGINQDLLLNILLNSTVINGEVQGNVWLGREKNNTGVYTPDMEDFKQAQKDEEIRNIKLSSNYQPGQVLDSKVEGKSIYLGTVWKYFDIKNNYCSHIDIKIFNKPKKCHVYLLDSEYNPYIFNNSKVKKIITDETEDKNIEKEWENIYKEMHRYDATAFYEEKGPLFDLQYSLKLKNKPVWVLEELLRDLCRKYYRYIEEEKVYITTE